MGERIIDLSMPIVDHVRWPVERRRKGDHGKGDLFEVTWLGVAVHAFTHMDSPRHFFADGATTSEIPLETTIGAACVIDLMPVAPGEAITAGRLEAAAGRPRSGEIRSGDIVVLRSAWDTQRDPGTEAFWREAPHLTRDACTWLLGQAPRAVAFDFPQDYCIRLLLDGEVRPLQEHVSHDVLLREGVILIEYLVNTAALRQPRVWFACLPLKVPSSDGAPARVIAIEQD